MQRPFLFHPLFLGIRLRPLALLANIASQHPEQPAEQMTASRILHQ
jgi:hypothetical protein